MAFYFSTPKYWNLQNDSSSFYRWTHTISRFFSSHSPISRAKYEELCAILNLKPGATKKELKKRYYELSLQFHPYV
ncbi:hypothetical protein HMI54_000505 [Coelomomyces lativittatus]|nr:hypothetical protein HMI54_000505 [Coelomomyces lativittatus]